MVWLKKVILYILSAFLLVFTSCDVAGNKPEVSKDEDKTNSKEDLVKLFLNQIQNWNSDSIQKIDSIGYEIILLDSALSYHSYENDYQPNSFMFSSNERNSFQVFEENEFLKLTQPIQQSTYKVWRKNLKNLKILDLSIEPHPTLGWLFIARLRGQE
ncbi:hypothetical protein [Brumimicrobium mesophilum]|uniref:hypothetical protein n=1 Tax=Brumimicrobium mesophilum TaxID=392717 RepID=UPI000D1419EA|nr:hypothetical protein [Brumimicrobium mesophilum]